MNQIAKVFTNGRSQAIRLPAAYRFDTKEVFVRQDPATGDVILSRTPQSWDGFFEALNKADVPEDFLDQRERAQGQQDRDPFKGWVEFSTGVILVTNDHAFQQIGSLPQEDWTV